MRKLFFLAALLLLALNSAVPAEEKKAAAEPARFFSRGSTAGAEILINGQSVIKIFSSSEAGVQPFERAEIISMIINYLSDNNYDLATIEPAMIDNIPIGIVGDIPVFSVEPGDTVGTSIPPLLLAYDWSNRIRRAFNGPLLSQEIFDQIVKIERLRGFEVKVRKKRIGEGSEVLINGRPVLTLGETDPDMSSYEKARTVAQALEEQIMAGRNGKDVRPEITSGSKYSLNIGGSVIPITSTFESEAGSQKLWNITLALANEIRQSLGTAKLSPNTFSTSLFQTGIASWYGGFFHGRRTSSGERFDMYAYTAAHRTLPFGTRLLVTRLDNSKSVIVTVTDRGPYISGRILDLSRAAAESIGMIGSGIAKVKVFVIERPDK